MARSYARNNPFKVVIGLLLLSCAAVGLLAVFLGKMVVPAESPPSVLASVVLSDDEQLDATADDHDLLVPLEEEAEFDHYPGGLYGLDPTLSPPDEAEEYIDYPDLANDSERVARLEKTVTYLILELEALSGLVGTMSEACDPHLCLPILPPPEIEVIPLYDDGDPPQINDNWLYLSVDPY